MLCSKEGTTIKYLEPIEITEEEIKIMLLQHLSILSKWDDEAEEAGPPKIQGTQKFTKAIISKLKGE
jgi:hypothetical protein